MFMTWALLLHTLPYVTLSADNYIVAYGLVNILNIQHSDAHDQFLTMLCTAICFVLWAFFLHLSYVAYCCVLWALPLCAMSTASWLYCMHMDYHVPWTLPYCAIWALLLLIIVYCVLTCALGRAALCQRYCCFMYWMLCTATCQWHYHFVLWELLLCIIVQCVLLHVLCNGHCCFLLLYAVYWEHCCLVLGHCSLIHCMLYTAIHFVTFVPWALPLHAYCMLCTATCFVPWILPIYIYCILFLMHVLSYGDCCFIYIVRCVLLHVCTMGLLLHILWYYKMFVMGIVALLHKHCCYILPHIFVDTATLFVYWHMLGLWLIMLCKLYSVYCCVL